MTAFFRDWLLGVVAAALAVSLAHAVTPEGTVKKVGRLVGGLVLLLAVARPLLQVDLEVWQSAEQAVSGWAEVDVQALAEENQNLFESLIAGQAEAYIEETEGAVIPP